MFEGALFIPVSQFKNRIEEAAKYVKDHPNE
jgi:hypothetical protein